MRNLAIQSDPLSPKRNDNAKTVYVNAKTVYVSAKTVVYKKRFGTSLLRTTIFGINKNNFVINNTLLQKPNVIAKNPERVKFW